MLGRVFVAQVTFFTTIGGKDVLIEKGDTVREGHPLLARDWAFKPLVVKYEHREPAKPPTPVAKKAVAPRKG
jgi:hypothetical protein